MKRTLQLLSLAIVLGHGSLVHAADPFTLTLVPSRSDAKEQGIVMGGARPKEFHVILTNVSAEPQPVFETSCSWGYQNISFEITTAGGREEVFSVKSRDWTANFPRFYLIRPGEQKVYSIRLDDWWELKAKEKLKPGDSLYDFANAVTMKAVYAVGKSDAGTEAKVWAGRVESKPCQVKILKQ